MASERYAGFFGTPMPLGAAPRLADTPGKTLVFPLQTQARSNWCWAAAAASVATFYGEPKDQCRVAADHLTGVACPNTKRYDEPGNDNKPQALDGPLSDLGHFRPPARLPPDFDALSGQIESGRPICGRIRDSGDGHFIVIVGYRVIGGIAEVVIADPDICKKFQGSFDYAGLSAADGPLDQVYFTQ